MAHSETRPANISVKFEQQLEVNLEVGSGTKTLIHLGLLLVSYSQKSEGDVHFGRYSSSLFRCYYKNIQV